MFTTREFDEPGPRRPRRLLLLAVVVAVVAAAAIAVALVVVPVHSEHDRAGGGTRPGSSETGTAPRDLQWQLVNGVRLPVSAEGPAHTDGPIASGYAHTPAGAVIAAWQISTRMLTDTRYEQILAMQVRADSGQRQQVRDEVTAVRNMTPDQFDVAFQQPAAFRVADYDPTFAAIYFAVPRNGGYAFEARAVLWDGRDWQYQVDSGLPDLPNSSGLQGFTKFQEG